MQRTPPTPRDLTQFRDHLARTESFSDRLVAERCRHTGHFDAALRDTLDVLGPLMGTWNTEILFVLRFAGPLRFNRILGTLAPISPRVLTDKLRHLEAHGFLLRRQVGTHADYALTDHGTRTTQLLHPLLYYLHNADDVDTATPSETGSTVLDAVDELEA